MTSTNGRLIRRRSSAGPLPPNPPRRPREATTPTNHPARATFLALRDHGKVYVSDLPRLSQGQLNLMGQEAREVLDSLTRRLQELEQQIGLSPLEQETRIRATTKRDVTERFIRAIEEEQEQRRNNPALRAEAGESIARTFLALARHRLPGTTFDALMQETLATCGDRGEAGLDNGDGEGDSASEPIRPIAPPPRPALVNLPRPASLPVVLSPDPSPPRAVG
ncbi:hypothetical protein KBY66_10095 [Synechococcus sp. Tobar12-5m-g]|uniref:hypothetical protein n=1 Tax=unclassified Synechococcus TaxID=2626047 RepID=UPI0020CF821E|nr:MULTISPECIES: hypothetical protein [unclassified Synechococcus]MCP9772975.1 hypothetical protein [Synechococcus sp. Tobar12-5m-g]MCP9873876.1 hypothetical protein [Synechococcus sp. Cruz CV-v-12]